MTHEPEITEPVLLCTDDASRLNPSARGWSRHPLHRANLGAPNGRNKRWDYWAVLAGDLVVSCVYSDIDVLGLADVWWADLGSGAHGGAGILEPPGALALPELCGTAPLEVRREGFELSLVDVERGTQLHASWLDESGQEGRFDLFVAQPEGHESLNVVIPWSEEEFNFTSKHQARPATGTFDIGDRRWVIGGEAGDAWGVLDVGRGRWPHEITWNWGGGAGRVGEHVIGLQLGAKWTEGSGFTENGLLIDGRLTKIGRELIWEYDWDDPTAPWRVRDPGGQLDVTLSVRFDKHTQAGDEAFGSEVHQVFGTWAGTVTDDSGRTISFDELQGFAEEARQRW